MTSLTEADVEQAALDWPEGRSRDSSPLRLQLYAVQTCN